MLEGPVQGQSESDGTQVTPPQGYRAAHRPSI
jgi:hypothetical protein